MKSNRIKSSTNYDGQRSKLCSLVRPWKGRGQVPSEGGLHPHAMILMYSSTTYSHRYESINQKTEKKIAYLTQCASSTTKPASFPCNLCWGQLHATFIFKTLNRFEEFSWKPEIFTFQCRPFRISRNDEFPAILSGVTYKSLHDGSSFLEIRKQNVDEKINWRNFVERKGRLKY